MNDIVRPFILELNAIRFDKVIATPDTTDVLEYKLVGRSSGENLKIRAMWFLKEVTLWRPTSN